MTNLEGRVILRRAGARPAADGVRTDLEVLAELAERLGQRRRGSVADPATVFDELRRASAGGRPTTAASPTSASPPTAACSGPARTRTTRARRGCSWIGSPTPDGRARFHAGQPPAAAEEPDDEFPLSSDHRPRAALTTSPARRPGASPALPRRAATRSSSCIRCWPAGTASPRATRCGCVTAAASARARARLTPDIRPDTVFMPFHWGGDGRAQPAHQPRARPPFAHARVQGLRRAHRQREPGDRHEETPMTADASVLTSHRPRFLQGVFAFKGAGLMEPVLLDPSLVYTVPPTARPSSSTSAPATPRRSWSTS